MICAKALSVTAVAKTVKASRATDNLEFYMMYSLRNGKG